MWEFFFAVGDSGRGGWDVSVNEEGESGRFLLLGDMYSIIDFWADLGVIAGDEEEIVMMVVFLDFFGVDGGFER